MRAGEGVTSLLAADPDLGAGLDDDARRQAETRIRVRVAPLLTDPLHGVWGHEFAGDTLGLLLVDGLIMRELTLLDNASAELLGPGDLIRPWDVDGGYDIPLRSDVLWTPLERARAAVLDARFLTAAAPWPSIVAHVCARGVERAQRRALYMSLSRMRRLDERLLILFWELCDRWGTASTRGFRIRLPLTHEILARLVAAHREPVTRALGLLAEQELVTREPDGSWLISPNFLERFDRP